MTTRSIIPVRLRPFTGLIDYAGLFPPAKLGMTESAENYATYQRGQHADLLGRLVLPISQLPELGTVAAASTAGGRIGDWRLSVIGTPDAASDAAAIADFNSHPGPRIVAVETKAADPGAIIALARCFPPNLEVWIEMPVAGDLEALFQAIQRTGRGAKIRTGGTTPDAFPPAKVVARFLAECVRFGVVAKATAGLHHAITGEYPLTYEAGSGRGRMYGFVNLFLAAALAANKTSVEQVAEVLEDTNPRNFHASATGFRWRAIDVSSDSFIQARRTLLRSFGSCSFTEPIEGLQSLRWL